MESWLATDAAAQAVHVTLIAQIANTYLAVRELDERIGIARNSVESRQESYRIFQRRYEVGATSKLDVAQVETLLTQAQSLLVQLQQQYKTQVHALWRLVGSDPGIFPDKTPFDETTVLTPLSAGLPSELMISRPDVIAAEHRLRASNANIGAARAAFFPRIVLTAGFGTASADLGGLFMPGSKAWAFMPTISLPIFDGGRRRANLNLSEVRRDIAVADYERTIQTAFREVADAFSARRWLSKELTVQTTARQA